MLFINTYKKYYKYINCIHFTQYIIIFINDYLNRTQLLQLLGDCANIWLHLDYLYY